jgi:hypothetical protein
LMCREKILEPNEAQSRIFLLWGLSEKYVFLSLKISGNAFCKLWWENLL